MLNVKKLSKCTVLCKTLGLTCYEIANVQCLSFVSLLTSCGWSWDLCVERKRCVRLVYTLHKNLKYNSTLD